MCTDNYLLSHICVIYLRHISIGIDYTFNFTFRVKIKNYVKYENFSDFFPVWCSAPFD